MNILVATGAISENYRTIDSVMLFHQIEPKGIFSGGGFDFDEAFEGAKALLRAKASALGGNAVINCDFEVRVANTQFTNQQRLEIFVFGTVVKIDAPEIQ